MHPWRPESPCSNTACSVWISGAPGAATRSLKIETQRKSQCHYSRNQQRYPRSPLIHCLRPTFLAQVLGMVRDSAKWLRPKPHFFRHLRRDFVILRSFLRPCAFAGASVWRLRPTELHAANAVSTRFTQ